MKFQTNRQITFEKNQTFLEKAEQLKPSLRKTTIKPQRLVRIVPDTENIYAYSAVTDDRSIDQLSNYLCGKDDRLILDFGDHEVGHFGIDINSVGSPMDAPLFLHLKFAELPVELAEKSTDYAGQLSKSWLQDEYIHFDTLPQHVIFSRRYACRYIMLEVIDSSAKWQASFSNPVFYAESAVDLATVKPAHTGDDKLDRIDRIGIKTLQDCMQQVFEDGPKRDRRLWLGDLRLQALANYATFDNQDLVKRCLYLFGALPAKDGRITTNVFTFTTPTPDDAFFFDYGLFFITTLFDYYNHYRDSSVVFDLYPVAKRELDVSLTTVGPDDLVHLGDKWFNFIDWNMTFNRDTAAQAVLIYALKQFVALTRIVGDTASTANYQARIQQLSNAAKTRLFDSSSGLFVSGPKNETNIASQVWMALAHVLPDIENHQLMTRTLNRFFPVHGVATPYLYHYIVTALFETDHSESAIQLMKDYWGKMVDAGADTFWETFDPNDPKASPYGSFAVNSFCHAWSCTPVYLIRKYVTHTYQDFHNIDE
ncbi:MULTISPECIES: alpha-L-rhamnosidase-related protein [Lacticaseibacillus]|uniref:alpha-L-rhamnosidase-related protein n=1 Tax=Lacticaseibacillus TaxID=2759736 RepID=UPI00063D8E37|nr:MULTISPECIES: family 78 glycoside hydrolase catalytic domain [Lacticaseibacillus]KLI75029.1 alpha-rhamnosidase [Lacticaseibacillus casei]